MIYLLRHLKTENNHVGIISGQSESPIIYDNSSKNFSYNFSDFHYVFSSPSQRCLDTLRVMFNPPYNPIIDTRILERNMGILENKTKTEMFQAFPDMFEKHGETISFKLSLTPPNGESFIEFYSRVQSFYNDMILPNSNKNILICSHNQSLKMLHFIFQNIYPTMDNWFSISFKNGSIVTYELTNFM